MSLDYGKVPKTLKLSTITPIPKVINANKASDLRPINTLPLIVKLLEMTVYNQLLKPNEIIKNQSSVRKKHSCESALQLSLCKFKKEFDNDTYLVVAFLVLKRAFETVDRGLLLTILKGYGNNGKVSEWFVNYLKDRKQKLRVREALSGECNTFYGVPQDSVIGPLLFVLYFFYINLQVDRECIHF